MSVPKSRRDESKFEATHHFYKLRKEVTDLVLNDFGFSEEKYLKKMEKYRQSHQSAANVEEVCERWDDKCQSFKKWYVDEEGRAILDLLRNITTEFTIGNSIYPSKTHAKLMEYLQRRYHINRAIGYCYTLKQEIQFAIETLPVDLNKYKRFAEMIDKQIALYKGVRSAGNKFLTSSSKGTLTSLMGQLFDSAIAVMRKISKIEQHEEHEENTKK